MAAEGGGSTHHPWTEVLVSDDRNGGVWVCRILKREEFHTEDGKTKDKSRFGITCVRDYFNEFGKNTGLLSIGWAAVELPSNQRNESPLPDGLRSHAGALFRLLPYLTLAFLLTLYSSCYV